MTTTTAAHHFFRAVALWCYGWKRRKQKDFVAYRFEWQDPASGHWYGEKTAIRLVKVQALTEYEKSNRTNTNY